VDDQSHILNFFWDLFRYLRAVAYRWIVKWLCGYVGWDNARPLPACIYMHIRKQYPSTETKGFMNAQQRE
jgi:hypothetical protein